MTLVMASLHASPLPQRRDWMPSTGPSKWVAAQVEPERGTVSDGCDPTSTAAWLWGVVLERGARPLSLLLRACARQSALSWRHPARCDRQGGE